MSIALCSFSKTEKEMFHAPEMHLFFTNCPLLHLNAIYIFYLTWSSEHNYDKSRGNIVFMLKIKNN